MSGNRHPVFWRLRAFEPPGKTATVEATYSGITCPVNLDHQRAGARTSDLNVILPNNIVENFVWTWFSDCLITEPVLQAFQGEHFVGFETRPVKARFETKDEEPPRLRHLIVTGWGGMASRESGLHLDQEKSCSVCGHLVYTGLSRSERLIDAAAWDGSDFFMVWPFPNFVFVTERVVKSIERFKLSGVLAVPGSEFEIEIDEEISPGRLSHSMPEPRAREIGEQLGIY
jgi:hypothetical protein